MDLLLRLVVWIIKELVKSNKKSTRLPQIQQSFMTAEQRLAQQLRKIAQRLTAIRKSARRQLESLGEFEQDLRGQLAPVLQQGVLDRSQELEEQVRQTSPATPHQGQQLSFDVQQLETVLKVTDEILRQRADEDDRAILGDADALANACYRPILDFARNHQLPIASNTPLTLFYPGGTFIELAFIEQGLVPIGLPHRYRSEPWRWPAIAHEIAHDFYASLPAIEPELVAKLDLDSSHGGQLMIGSEAFDRFLYGIWLEEIFADAVGSLMLGPAYLRAMTAIFSSPESPDDVVLIPAEQGVVDPHPPRHLRVHITARFLHRQGFGSEARDLVQDWDQAHGPPEYAHLGTPYQYDGVPFDSLLTLGNTIADGIYQAELKALAGHRLADLPGLGFSSLHAQRVEKAIPELAAGRPVSFDARTLIAAATEAALDHPESIEQINEATRLSIVGVGTGERKARVRALARGAQSRIGNNRAQRTRRIVEALLLGELLEAHPRRVC